MREYTRNIEACVNNVYQGKYKKVLCVCSGGCLRSPTAALVLSQAPWNWNTRSCGLSSEFAIIELDDVLFNWCDMIVVMSASMEKDIRIRYNSDKKIINLNIPDRFAYRDAELIDLIKNAEVIKDTLEN